MVIARSFALLSNISIGNSKQAITLGYKNIFEIFLNIICLINIGKRQ